MRCFGISLKKLKIPLWLYLLKGISIPKSISMNPTLKMIVFTEMNMLKLCVPFIQI